MKKESALDSTPGITRVAVGMSGGVDSSVAALLLVQQGFDVTGLTMTTWRGSSEGSCSRGGACWGPGEGGDVEKAAGICWELGIRHVVLDLAAEFEESVLKPFRESYASGLTPNPCVLCNRKVKFGALFERVAEDGTAPRLFATGHYARVEHHPPPGRQRLLRGLDPAKDQSYFLALLSQEQLARTIFPLGSMTKAQVRQIAVEHGWGSIAACRESQDFAEEGGYGNILGAGSLVPGLVVSEDGLVLGRHKGTALFTIGQRKGLGIGGGPEPLYVTGIDPANATVVVGPRASLLSSSLRATGMNWIACSPPPEEFRAEAKIRSRHEAAAAIVRTNESGASVEVEFDQPQPAIAPGQFVVLYDGDFVLGAGTIARLDP
jgi:tRNA-specific 2-thiouridylase